MRAKARLTRRPAHCLDGAVILRIAARGGEMQLALGLEHRAEPLDQRLMDSVELIRSLRQDARADLIFQPLPLEGGALVKRSRGIRVIFQQLRRAIAIIGEIETTIDFGVAALPALRNQIAVRDRDREPIHQRLALQNMRHRLAAHCVQLGRRILDPVLDLLKREFIGRGLIPIGLTMHIREGKADLLRVVAPVWPL